ncbi:hypothetical protein KKF34_18350 [Myxococcota bacterium]|nr:hypothetical protein [Myxococcota bacterium]MBU1379822.1 hypothetical protein [Myxococcota bacterium]MBU1498846.1 hypothetical protein [Myxococcota bacterium]
MKIFIKFLLITVLFISGCDDSDSENNNINNTNNSNNGGKLHGPCLENDICDEGLRCVLDICEVDPCFDFSCPENAHCTLNGDTPQCVCDENHFISLDGNCNAGDSLNQREFFQSVYPTSLEDRYYYLYIPQYYSHTEPSGLLVDLHGTATIEPEVAYGLDYAKDAASELEFILLRPRSRSSEEGGYTVYRWDQNFGDPQANHDFINDLTEDISNRYNIDPERIYIMGFSSGTNQTSIELIEGNGYFSGFGFIGGGVWSTGTLNPDMGRIYLNTGFRDYMRPYHYELEERLEDANYPSEVIFSRETDAGHELYDIYYELFQFLDEGTKPDEGTLDQNWTQTAFPENTSLLSVGSTPDGTLIATGSDNSLFMQLTDSSWQEISISGTPAFHGRAVTSFCFTTDGTGLAIGEGQFLRSFDSGTTWQHEDYIDEIGSPVFGYQYLNSIACHENRAVAVGFWSASTSIDGGNTWTTASIPTSYGYAAQGAFVSSGNDGTFLAGGYYAYLGVSSDGINFSGSEIDSYSTASWFYDGVKTDSGRWIAVGDHGTIIISDDDGNNFSCSQCSGDLAIYAVDSWGSKVIAAGDGGKVLLSEDDGSTWADISTGLDIMIGAVYWINETTVIVAGQNGTILTRTF